MSFLKKEDANRWILTFIAFAAVLLTFLIVRFFYQMGEFFDLEAKISSFRVIVQIVSAGLGLVAFIVAIKNNALMAHLDGVYSEMLKVSWADIQSTNKITMGVIVGVVIVSTIFVIIDYFIGKLFNLIY